MPAPIFAAALRVVAGRAAGGAAARGAAAEGISMGSAVEDVSNITKNLKKDVKEGSEEAVANGAQIVHAEILNSIREAGSVASSQLLQSVTVGAMTASTDQAAITVGSSSSYAYYVEHGRSAGKRPPTEEILEWMTAKGIEADARAAYLIARKIGKDGIAGKHVFQKGIEKAEPQIQSSASTIIINKVDKN